MLEGPHSWKDISPLYPLVGPLKIPHVMSSDQLFSHEGSGWALAEDTSTLNPKLQVLGISRVNFQRSVLHHMAQPNSHKALHLNHPPHLASNPNYMVVAQNEGTPT